MRLRPKFNFLLFLIIYSGTLFPFQMYLIPVYRLFNVLGLYDTRTGMVLIYSAICIPFSLFVYRGFYTTIPREIEEAAKLDGCGPVRSFVSVFLPQSLPPTAVVALFQMTWIWNDLLFGMVLSRTQHVRPIMVAVATMTGYGGGNIPWIMTGGHLHLRSDGPAVHPAAAVLHPGNDALDLDMTGPLALGSPP